MDQIQSDKYEEYKKKVQWGNLPIPALERIYYFANSDDKLNMSVVSRKWSEGFRSPSLCKTFRFDMTKSLSSIRTCSRLKFVRKYSSMFQHIEVSYKFTRWHLATTWCKHLEEFLQILASRTQLISINFRDLKSFDYYTPDGAGDRICRAIAKFFESQHHLERVEFKNCYFIYSAGVQILKSLIENNQESIMHLILSEFVHPHEIWNSNAVLCLPMLLSLPRFTLLQTEYSPTFVSVFGGQSCAVDVLKKRQTRVPQKIILVYGSESRERRGLTEIDWRFLKEMYPDLEVEFTLKTYSPSLQEVEVLIMPNMPITRLNYVCCKDIRRNSFPLMGVDVLFHHLLACKTNDYLVSLTLIWNWSISNLDSILIPFLLACRKLKHLKLTIAHPTDGIHLLFDSWLGNRPESLENVVVVIFGCTNEYELINSIPMYQNNLRLVGLNLDVDFKLIR